MSELVVNGVVLVDVDLGIGLQHGYRDPWRTVHVGSGAEERARLLLGVAELAAAGVNDATIGRRLQIPQRRVETLRARAARLLARPR